MICIALKDFYYVEWFVLRWIICTTLNDLCSVELFVKYWIISTKLNNFYYLEKFVQSWMICTALNDSECDGWTVQHWIIWTKMNYWVSAFQWVLGVLIRESTARYFTLTTELIFSSFRNIKKKCVWTCARNWS